MTDYIDNPTPPNREDALQSIECGKNDPFDGRPATDDWARNAALGIFANFCDRRGIRQELEGFDDDVKEELVDTVAEIIRAAKDTA